MDIKDLIRSVGGEIIELDVDVKTVSQASKATGLPPDHIIKSLVFIGEREAALVIVSGDKRVNLDKLARFIGKCRLATPREALMLTGFEVGGMPPIGVPLRTIVDSNLVDKEYVVGGGGDIKTLSKLKVDTIIKYQSAEIYDIT